MATIDILKSLQSEVGSRRAGTEGERRAQVWLMARCQALGLPVELDEFRFIGSERYRPLFQLASMVLLLITGLLVFRGQALFGLGLLTLYFLYTSFFHKRVELRLAGTASRNVIAGLRRPLSEYVADPQKGPAFLICAHYDTPRNFPGWFARLRGAYRIIGPLVQLGLLAFSFVSGSYLAGVLLLIAGIPVRWLLALGPWIGWLGALFLLPLLLMQLVFGLYALFSRKTDSPGADDNGSGTTLVLELARRLKENPPANAEVFFAWWGAEEAGLFGSRQFLRRFHDRLDKDKLYLINADCVGVAECLTVHVGQGVSRRRRTDPATVERVERLAQGLGIRAIRAWESPISGGSSDHSGWVEKGYTRSVSLIREDYRPLSLPARAYAFLMRLPYANQLELKHIHSPQDTLEGIRPEVLHGTTDLAEAYVREVDAVLGQNQP